jgi:hypothetical protein
MLVGIEICWNLFPPSYNASLILFIIHANLLIMALVLSKYPLSPYLVPSKKGEKLKET